MSDLNNMVEQGDLEPVESPDNQTALFEVPTETQEDGSLKVQIGKDSYAWIHELDGFESLKADAMISGANVFVTAKLYALFAVSRLQRKGVDVQLRPCKDDAQVWARSKQFTGRELLVLMQTYAEKFMSNPLDEASIKK